MTGRMPPLIAEEAWPLTTGLRPIRLKRVKVRINRSGGLYIALTLVLGIVAVNSGNNFLFLAVGGLLSLMSLSGILAYVNLQGLWGDVRLSGDIYAGRPVTAGLLVANRKRRWPSFLLGFGPGASKPLLMLGPFFQDRISLNLTFPKRGQQPLGDLSISSPFPFGFFRRGGTFALENWFIVFPQPKAVPWFLVEGARRLGEELSTSLPGIGGDYRSLRDYRPGDPLSKVSWKTWLRHRRYLTKEFDSEGAPPVVFSYHEVPGPGVEAKLSQLTWLIRTTLRRGRAVGLSLPGAQYAPGSGPAHKRTLLTALALFGSDGHAPP